MTFPVTPDPSIHTPSASMQKNSNAQAVAQLRALFARLPEVILDQVVAWVKKTTGIDLSGFEQLLLGIGQAIGMVSHLGDFLPNIEKAFQGIDLNNPVGAIIHAIENAVEGLVDGSDWQGLLNNLHNAFTGTESTINRSLTDVYNAAKDFFGRATINLIPSWRLPSIPVAHLANTNPNLLISGGFDSVDAVDPSSTYTWDGTVGHSSSPLGSAKVIANGTVQSLNSNTIDVTANQTLQLDGYVTWSGVVASGAAFQLSVVGLVDSGAGSYTQVGSPTVIGQVSDPAASAGWTHLTGTFSVPAGIDAVCVRITVTGAVTAGSVWWDDLSAKKAGLIAQNLIQDLENALSAKALQADLAATWNTLFGSNALGTVLQAPALPDITKAMSTDLTTTYNNLANLINQLLHNPEQALGHIGAVIVDDAAATMANLLDALHNAFGGGSGTGAKVADVGSVATSARQKTDAIATNMYNGWYQAGGTSDAGQVTTVMEGIKNTVQGGYAVQTLTASGSWNVPTGTILDFWAICIGGGDSGGTSNNAPGGPGGNYVAQQINPASLPAAGTAISYTIGAGGSAGTAGADSSFGSLASSAGASTASIASLFGFYDANASAPGTGGQGGLGGTSTSSSVTAGTAGTSTPLATGGTGGSRSASASAGGAGLPGGNADTTGQTRAGGAGGGGGGGSYTGPGGAGGAGGFPGGGGGGAGGGHTIGAPGPGGNGCIILLYRMSS